MTTATRTRRPWIPTAHERGRLAKIEARQAKIRADHAQLWAMLDEFTKATRELEGRVTRLEQRRGVA